LDIPWLALIGQSISIVVFVAHSSSIRVKDSLEIDSRTKMDSLKSILNGGVSLSKLGGIVLVETLE